MDSEIGVTFFVIAVHRWASLVAKGGKFEECNADTQRGNFGECNTGMCRDASLKT